MTLPGDAALPLAAARRLLDHHADRLPDLSGLVVLVPNHRAGLDFARALARLAGRTALIPPDIVPLKSWAERYATGPVEPAAARLARLHAVLRHEAWLGPVDKWALAEELLHLADALSAERTGEAAPSQLRARYNGQLEREIALIEAVWRTLNGDSQDPQARYARALDAAAQAHADAPRPSWVLIWVRLPGSSVAFSNTARRMRRLTSWPPTPPRRAVPCSSRPGG